MLLQLFFYKFSIFLKIKKSCPQGHGTILDVYNEKCIFINVIVFYFVFSAVFIGEGQNLTNYFTFWLYLCKFV